jgi:hypothetical protein
MSPIGISRAVSPLIFGALIFGPFFAARLHRSSTHASMSAASGLMRRHSFSISPAALAWIVTLPVV